MLKRFLNVIEPKLINYNHNFDSWSLINFYIEVDLYIENHCEHYEKIVSVKLLVIAIIVSRAILVHIVKCKVVVSFVATFIILIFV